MKLKIMRKEDQEIIKILRKAVSFQLPDEISMDKTLLALGLDSIDRFEFFTDLEDEFDIEIPRIYDWATLETISAYVWQNYYQKIDKYESD